MSNDQAARNRERFPHAARFVDAMRDVFGAGVKLEYAEESGREVGTRDLAGVAIPLNRMVLRAPDVPAQKKKGKR